VTAHPITNIFPQRHKEHKENKLFFVFFVPLWENKPYNYLMPFNQL